jgi:Protein of unknown function (DUF2950)
MEIEVMYCQIKSLVKRRSISNVVGLCTVLLTGYFQVYAAQPSSQQTFSSAEEASHALWEAADTQNSQALRRILGPSNELSSSNDSAQDQLDREQFVRKYQEMHRLVRQANGQVVLYIGAENWPFPIPIVSRHGVWHFDSDAGKEEVLNRRIGENEMAAIDACRALAAAANKPPEHPDANDPVEALLVAARAGTGPAPYQGYYFRILSGSGNNDFDLVAYPVEYQSSGVMTFVTENGGVVYQKDLGPNTQKVATQMSGYHIDSTWKPAEEAGGSVSSDADPAPSP